MVFTPLPFIIMASESESSPWWAGMTWRLFPNGNEAERGCVEGFVVIYNYIVALPYFCNTSSAGCGIQEG